MKRKIKLFIMGILFVTMFMTEVMQVFATDGPSSVISAGQGVTFAVKNDGSLWGYGNTANGRLAVESKNSILEPIKVMDDVKSVVSNELTSFAIKNDNTLWAWGSNGGKYGTGDGKSSVVPVKIMDDVKMVAVEHSYALIIKTDGSLWGSGQLPGKIPGFNGSTIYEFKPIMEGETFKFVSACGYYAMVIKENGELWGWGLNSYAALGTGDRISVTTPVKIMENVAFVSVNSFSSMMVKEDGSLYMCGTGYNGKFYNGKTVVNKINGDGYVKSPMKIMDNVLYAASNGNRWLVVKKDHTLWGWGSDAQFGLFAPLSKNTMMPAKLADNVSYVSAGARHIVVLKTDQTLWTGGQNASGGIAGHKTEYKSYKLQLDMKDIMDDGASNIKETK